MIDSTSPGVKVSVCIGRSKVTFRLLTVPFTTVFVLLPPGTEVPVTCGPGTMIGRVFWLNGGLRMFDELNVTWGVA